MQKPLFLPKLILAFFLLAQIFGFARHRFAVEIYTERDLRTAEVSRLHEQVRSGLSRRVSKARTDHPKYAADLTVDNLSQALLQEKVALEKAGSGLDPRPAKLAAARARLVLVEVQRQVDGVSSTIDRLDAALATYSTVAGRIRAGAGTLEGRVSQHVADGFRRSHFADVELLISQLREQAGRAANLSKVVDPRDGKPDYLRIYEIGENADGLLVLARELAERAPKLRRTVNDLAGSAKSYLSTLEAGFYDALDAAYRVERYTSYRQKGFVAGLRARQSESRSIGRDLIEISRLNSMEVQNFVGAKSLLDKVRARLSSTDKYLQAVHSFDRAVRSAVANLPAYHSTAQSAISRAQSHIIRWQSENNQSEAISALREARNRFQNARLLEATDPILALQEYRIAASAANRAYDEVDTYVPPRRNDDDDNGWSSSSSSSGGWGGSSSSGGSSSGGSMGGSYSDGPGSGSFGDGG